LNATLFYHGDTEVTEDRIRRARPLSVFSVSLWLLLLAACAAHPVVPQPAAEFDHPFHGRVVEHVMHYRGGTLLSLSATNHIVAGFTGRPRCEVWLPGVNDPGITADLVGKLRRYEVALCNGGPDLSLRATR